MAQKKFFKNRISIITVVFNNIDTIAAAIDSVNHQKYKNIEHIIIDGSSTDGTIEKIKEKLSKKTKFFSEPDSGIYDAINKGIVKSSGDIIGLLHSDDLFSNSNVISDIEKQFSDTSLDVIYADLIYIKKYKKRIYRYWKAEEFDAKNLFWGWMPPHPTIFVRKRVFDKFGLYNKSYRISADYDFILRIFSSPDVNIKYIPKVIVCMSLGGASNKSIRNIFIKMKEDYLILKRNDIGGFFSVVFKNFRKINQFFK